jgi:hypothetical protein
MRASGSTERGGGSLSRPVYRRPRAGLCHCALLAGLLLALPSFAEDLAPAFRLPIAGRALAGPVIDAHSGPDAAWILSEDHSLYLLSSAGTLLSRIPLPLDPRPFLAVDPAGRAIVLFDESWLAAYTRAGREAWRTRLDALPALADGAVLPRIAFGSDERIFIAAGPRLACYSQAGRRLWAVDLPAALAAGPAIDGAGRPVVGLADGSIVIFSPYGEAAARATTGSVYALGAFVRAPAGGAGGQGGGGATAPQSLVAPGLPLLAVGCADGRPGTLGSPSLLLLDSAGRAVATLALSGKAIGFASDGATLYALEAGGRLSGVASNGSLLWSADTGVTDGAISLYSDRLAVTGKGRAVSVSLRGSILKEASFTNSSSACALSPSGLLFSPGADWVLGAYHFEKSLGPPVEPRPPDYGGPAGLDQDSPLYDPALMEASRRIALLADFDAKLEAGAIGAEEARARALATAIALGSFEPNYPASQARFRTDPFSRARAAALLGRLGSPECVPFLARVFAEDGDSSVRAAACEAIAAIGRDPEGAAGAAFSAAASGVGGRLDGEAAAAVVEAIVALATRSGSSPGVDALRALLALSAPPNDPNVRNAAGKALSRIAGTLGP